MVGSASLYSVGDALVIGLEGAWVVAPLGGTSGLGGESEQVLAGNGEGSVGFEGEDVEFCGWKGEVFLVCFEFPSMSEFGGGTGLVVVWEGHPGGRVGSSDVDEDFDVVIG